MARANEAAVQAALTGSTLANNIRMDGGLR